MSEQTRCPSCGLVATEGSWTCPLCHAVLNPVDLRRVALWGFVAVEYVAIAILLAFRTHVR
jgi:hypothetical protein